LHYRDKIQKELPQEQEAERRNLELRQTLMALRTEQVALERKIQKMREERAEVIEKAVSSNLVPDAISALTSLNFTTSA
jgi:DNA repair ATPase RecN